MPASDGSARCKTYKRLKKGFRKFSGMLNVHLEDTLLREMGVDAIQINLEEETERGGPYFLPMSQERMDSLDYRPDFRITFDEEWSSSVWDLSNANNVWGAFRGQLYCNNDWSGRIPYRATHWEKPAHHSTYELLLREHHSRDRGSDPRWQFKWSLIDRFVAEKVPHRTCISLAGIPNVRGLVRSEMMIVTGMMIAALREQRNKDVVIVPVVLVSVIGIYARLIQAHVSLEERRLKVRYSQLHDMDNCSQRLMDIFLRWILSSPLLEPKLQYEASQSPGGPSGNTAPQVTVLNACGERPIHHKSRSAMESTSAVGSDDGIGLSDFLRNENLIV